MPSESVAEHVMGWHRTYVSETVAKIGSVWADKGGKLYLIPLHDGEREQDLKLLRAAAQVWAPHRDIAAAWSVVLAIFPSRLHIHQNYSETDLPGNAKFQASIKGDRGTYAGGKTAEVAICRAALLASIPS